MKIKLLLGVLAVGAVTTLNSCKDDEVPIAGVNFELAEQEVTESDGSITSFHPEATDDGEGRVVGIKITFDRPLAGDAVLKFGIRGTASIEATDDELNDYEIVEESDNLTINDDELTILKGAESVEFQVRLFEDVLFEYDEDVLNEDEVSYETIELELESVVSGPVKIGGQLEHTLKILEDDAVAFLFWEAQDMDPTAAEVDMDMIFWTNGDITWFGAREGTDFEGVNIPAGLPAGSFGISYTYYSGKSDDLDFEGVLFSTAGTLNGSRYTYPEGDAIVLPGTYMLKNINAWGETSLPKIAVTATKSGINYSNISSPTIHDTGSRLKSHGLFKLDKSMLRKVAVISRENSMKGLVRK